MHSNRMRMAVAEKGKIGKEKSVLFQGKEEQFSFSHCIGDFVNGLFSGLNKGNSLVGGGSP